MSKEVQNQLPTTAAVFFCVIQRFFLSACECPIIFLIFNTHKRRRGCGGASADVSVLMKPSCLTQLLFTHCSGTSQLRVSALTFPPNQKPISLLDGALV